MQTQPTTPRKVAQLAASGAMPYQAAMKAADRPRVVRGSSRHPEIAAALNQTIRLPRWRSDRSYSRQLVTRRFARGGVAGFSARTLCGTAATSRSTMVVIPYPTSASMQHAATRWSVPRPKPAISAGPVNGPRICII